MMQYIESNELREVLIELDQYHLNDEPYENEIEDYIQIIKNNNNEDSLESLNYKLRKHRVLEIQNYKNIICNLSLTKIKIECKSNIYKNLI